MNYIKQNIKHLRESKSLSQADFGKLFDYSRDNIASYERGTDPKIDLIQKIVNYFHISFDDFINNELSTITESDMTKKDVLAEPTNEFVLRTDTREAKQIIPLYDHLGAASLTRVFEGHQNIIDYITIPNLPKSDGALYITGDSMYPLLKSGDIAIYKRLHDMVHGILFGEMYILSVRIDDDLTTVVKFVQKSERGEEWIKLVSQNSYHAPKDFHLKDVVAMAMVKASIRINSMM